MIEAKENCPTCGAPDTFLTAANEWRDLYLEMVRESERLAKINGEMRAEFYALAQKCVSYAGEDFPAGYRACVWCGLIESSSKEFHKPGCPVVKALRYMSK